MVVEKEACKKHLLTFYYQNNYSLGDFQPILAEQNRFLFG
jgi:hypothetical protein